MRNAAMRSYRRGAEERDLNWELDEITFDRLTAAPCHYCGRKPSNRKEVPRHRGAFVYSGIDRVDNMRGYEPDNVVPCCRICNRAKHQQTYAEFTA
jgi:5-methylcytosine-specific restriction endonuclease McrA